MMLDLLLMIWPQGAPQHGNPLYARDCILEQPRPILAPRLIGERRHARDIAAGPGKACDSLPLFTGSSPLNAMTMGIVDVAFRAARIADSATATMTSTFIAASLRRDAAVVPLAVGESLLEFDVPIDGIAKVEERLPQSRKRPP